LRLRPGGEDNNGASDDQRGAHTPMRADRVSPCKAGESRGDMIAVRYARSSPETAAPRDFNPLFVGFGSKREVRFQRRMSASPGSRH
jgi:hypothetical protein